MGESIDDVGAYIQQQLTRKPSYYNRLSRERMSEMDDNEFIIELMDLARNMGMDGGDLDRTSSYGEVVRDGQPRIVLVDFGLTTQVYDDYYKVQLK